MHVCVCVQEVVGLMTSLASKLNLADHCVYMGGEAVARSTVCGDVEVHRVDDNSVLMFSAHRLFTTAPPQKAVKYVAHPWHHADSTRALHCALVTVNLCVCL